MYSIQTRLAALADVVERRRLIQSEPIDGLSASLYAFERGLAELDDVGRADFLEELNLISEDGTEGLNMDAEALTRMIEGAKA